MQDAWRAYLEMALGLTEVPRKKAQKVAGDLVNRGGATAAQLQGLVEDLMSAGMSNREALTNIVRYEVDKALGVVGLATAEEVADLTARVRDLERQLRAAQARATAAEAAAPSRAGLGGERLNQPAPLPTKAAKKAVAKKATKAPPNQMPKAATTPAKKAASKAMPPAPAGTAESPMAAVKEAAAATELPPAPVKRTHDPAKHAPARKTAVKKAVAKKAVAKKAPAKKVPPPPKSTDSTPEV